MPRNCPSMLTATWPDRSSTRTETTSSAASTRLRLKIMCGATGVITMPSSRGDITGPPAEKL